MSGVESPRIAFVVLNWNGSDDTLECLKSLRGQSVPLDVLIVDNGSNSRQIEILRAGLTSEMLIETGNNLGYAGGNNVGLQWALNSEYEWILILNNDTIAAPDMLARLLEAAKQAPQFSCFSPMIITQRTKETWFSGAWYDTIHARPLHGNRLIHPGLYESAFLTGCALFAHRDVWLKVGLFDESLFLIFEDSDWSERARRLGVNLLVEPKALLSHKVSATINRFANVVSAFYFARNGVRFNLKWYGQKMAFRFSVQSVLLPQLRSLKHHEVGLRSVRASLLGLAAGFLRNEGKVSGILAKLLDAA